MYGIESSALSAMVLGALYTNEDYLPSTAVLVRFGLTSKSTRAGAFSLQSSRRPYYNNGDALGGKVRARLETMKTIVIGKRWGIDRVARVRYAIGSSQYKR